MVLHVLYSSNLHSTALSQSKNRHYCNTVRIDAKCNCLEFGDASRRHRCDSVATRDMYRLSYSVGTVHYSSPIVRHALLRTPSPHVARRELQRHVHDHTYALDGEVRELVLKWIVQIPLVIKCFRHQSEASSNCTPTLTHGQLPAGVHG
jgi:hypothetical protein